MTESNNMNSNFFVCCGLPNSSSFASVQGSQMRALLEVMLTAAERGAAIAHASRLHCRGEPAAHEKVGDEANPRFARDFKTIADVLVQESVSRDLVKKFPELKDHIHGEENNSFVSLCGESVSVTLHDKEAGTAKMLQTLMHTASAKVLAQAVHAPVTPPDLSSLPSSVPRLDMNDVGIWIDPLDGTNEFIRGGWGDGPGGRSDLLAGRTLRGLPCVTILIGAFLRSTGEPIMGVINQPFYNKEVSRSVWGVCHAGVRCCSLGEPGPPTSTLLVSGSEGTVVCYRVMTSGFTIMHPPGAGLKLLQVALGESDGYVLSRDSSYRWDTCGPHAILRSLGGDVLTFTPPHAPLLYHPDAANRQEEGVQRYANRGGIVAYRHAETLERLKQALF